MVTLSQNNSDLKDVGHYSQSLQFYLCVATMTTIQNKGLSTIFRNKARK